MSAWLMLWCMIVVLPINLSGDQIQFILDQNQPPAPGEVRIAPAPVPVPAPFKQPTWALLLCGAVLGAQRMCAALLPAFDRTCLGRTGATSDGQGGVLGGGGGGMLRGARHV